MFEFYFQSGEFAAATNDFWEFVKDLTIQVVGALVAAWAAIKLYFRQQQDQIVARDKEKVQKEVDDVVFLEHLISNSMGCIHGQIQMYHKFASDIKEADFLLPEIHIVKTSDALDRLINKTDHKSFFHSYRSVNRREKFDPRPDSFQTGMSIFEFLLGKIVNDLDNFTSNYADCNDIAKWVSETLKSIYVLSARYHAQHPTDSLVLQVEHLKTELDNIQSDNIPFVRRATRTFFSEVLALLTVNQSSKLPAGLWEVAEEAAEAITLYDQLDFRRQEMHTLATENEQIFKQEFDRLDSIFAPLKAFVVSNNL